MTSGLTELVTLFTGGSAALYSLSAVAHLSLMFRREYAPLARWATRAAWLVQSLGLAFLVVEQARFPIFSLFEVSHALVWLLMTIYVGLEFLHGNQAAGSFLTPVIAAVITLSLALPKSGVDPYLGAHPARLAAWHVGVTLLGYVCFIGAFVAGALYLIQDRNLRRKHFGPLYFMLPSLERLDRLAVRMIHIGFPLMTLGVAAGLSFAQITWATFWQSDLKVIFTLLIWVVYGIYLLMRQLWGWGGRRAAWWVVAAGLAVLVNYMGVNFASAVHRFGV